MVMRRIRLDYKGST